MDRVEELLQQIVKGLVNFPDEVQTFVSDDTDEKGELVMINVKVNKGDVGTCIGEGGKTAEAIRKVIGLVGFKQLGKRVYVKVDAPKIPRNHFQFD